MTLDAAVVVWMATPPPRDVSWFAAGHMAQTPIQLLTIYLYSAAYIYRYILDHSLITAIDMTTSEFGEICRPTESDLQATNMKWFLPGSVIFKPVHAEVLIFP